MKYVVNDGKRRGLMNPSRDVIEGMCTAKRRAILSGVALTESEVGKEKIER